jgi:hypothetical protein
MLAVVVALQLALVQLVAQAAVAQALTELLETTELQTLVAVAVES